MKVADLFSGVGGMSQGFTMAGFEIEMAIEYDKEIAASFQKNHPQTDVYAEDIRNINFSEIHKKHPTIDIVMGGPPCQGFSQKGKRKIMDNIPTRKVLQKYFSSLFRVKP